MQCKKRVQRIKHFSTKQIYKLLYKKLIFLLYICKISAVDPEVDILC